VLDPAAGCAGAGRCLTVFAGESPSGKAPDFDSGIRGFESYLPSHTAPPGLSAPTVQVALNPSTIGPQALKFRDLVMPYADMMVFTGNANPKLAEDVVRHLNIHLGRATVGRFSDGEVMVEILENVRGKDVFVLQSTCPPSNDNLMEVLVMVDALKRASAGRITAAIPYFGYARQDRRPRSARVPITAKMIANMLTSAGVDRVLTMDLHSDQIQGFFDIPVDNIYATPILLGDLWKHDYEDMVVVSPDVGGVVRARAVAKRLESDLAIIDKRRPKPNVATVMNIIGEVEERTCVIMDDLVDTANTLCEAAQALKDHGAKRVLAYCTHPVLSGRAVERISQSVLDELVVTDTIPLREDAQKCSKIRQLTVAGLLAETMLRISNEDSVSSLFME
jgi:ribose-phosphate pyrophosphokinase